MNNEELPTSFHDQTQHLSISDQDTTKIVSTSTPTLSSDKTTIIESRENALPIGTKLGEFEITDIIGWGGFGIVYLAYDHALQRQVALKEYMPSSLAIRDADGTISIRSEKNRETYQAGLRSFINEARILAKLQEHAEHLSLVKVFQFWESQGTAYMVMPFYQGKTLKETLLSMKTRPDERWLRNLLTQILDALSILHKENCLHRDIAPDNILLLEDGRAVLLDFGAARQVIGDLTQTLTIILKPGYAPIEQYAEEMALKQGPWTDIYALAAVIYYAITGNVPPSSTSRLIANDPLIPLSQLAINDYSATFLKAIDKALSLKPTDRPQTINEFKALLGDSLPKNLNVNELQSPDSRLIRTLQKTIAIVVTLLVFIGVVYYYLTDHQSPKKEKPLPPEHRFDPVVVLEEIFDHRDRSHAVTVSIDKAQFKINKDQLKFNINSAKAGYVYTLAVSSDRSTFLLFFPNEVDKENYIQANGQIELPRNKWKLTAKGPEGTNHFIVIVSKHPRDFTHTGLIQQSFFGQFPLGVSSKLYQSYTGAIPLFAGKAKCIEVPNQSCSESYGAVLFSIKEVE